MRTPEWERSQLRVTDSGGLAQMQERIAAPARCSRSLISVPVRFRQLVSVRVDHTTPRAGATS